VSVNTYQLLKNIGLTDARVIRMLPGIKSQVCEADQVICTKGDKRQPFFYILRGLVCVSKPCEDSEHNPINIFGPGTWFGEAGFLNDQTSGFNYLCLTPAHLLNIPFGDAVDAFEHDASFARYLARLTQWRDQQHAEMLTLMRIGSPALRVVMGLCLLSEALLSNSSHMPINRLDDALEIPLKQSLLAGLCGVSRGIFSVCLQQLAAAGWLNINYATIEIKSIQTWQHFLNSQRHSRQNTSKPSMDEILVLLQLASANDLPMATTHNPRTPSVSGTH
jgi:CRP-like cAMP-binding protein